MPQAFDWQMLITLVLVGAAAHSVVLRVRRLFAGQSSSGACGSGGCGSCPSNQQAGDSAAGRSLPLVSLDVDSTPSAR